MSKILEMPKSTAQLWSDLFNGFLSDIDKVAEHQKAQVSCGAVDGHRVGMASTSPRLSSGLTNRVEGGRNHYEVSDSEPTPNSQSIGLKPLSTRGSGSGNAPPAGIQAHQQSQEMVNLDDLGIGLGDEPLPDEEPWTDSKTTAEMWNSIKGR